MHCPKCGKENKSNANFCAKCGYKFKNNGIFNKNSEDSFNSSNKFKMIVLALVIIVVLVVSVTAQMPNIINQDNITQNDTSNFLGNKKVSTDVITESKVNNSLNNGSDLNNIGEYEDNNSYETFDDSNNEINNDYYYDEDDEVFETNYLESSYSDKRYSQKEIEENNTSTYYNENSIEINDLNIELTEDKIFLISGTGTLYNYGQYTMVMQLIDANGEPIGNLLVIWAGSSDQYSIGNLLVIWAGSSDQYSIGDLFEINTYSYGEDLSENAITAEIYIFNKDIQTRGDEVEENLDLSTAILYDVVLIDK